MLEVIYEIEAVVGCAALWANIMILVPFLLALVGLFCEDYATRLVWKITLLFLVSITLVISTCHVTLSDDARGSWPYLKELVFLLWRCPGQQSCSLVLISILRLWGIQTCVLLSLVCLADLNHCKLVLWWSIKQLLACSHRRLFQVKIPRLGHQ